jgi:hypothetical protein
MRLLLMRLVLCIPVVLLGMFLVNWTRFYIWREYWIIVDGERGTAVITQVFQPKRNVAYRYTVDQTEYTGFDQGAEEEGRFWKPAPGEKCIVHYSSSHPWLSSLHQSSQFASGLPAILVGLLMEAFFIWMIIDPRSLMGRAAKSSQTQRVTAILIGEKRGNQLFVWRRELSDHPENDSAQ